ncbi:MAG: hypothetical protein AABW80_03910 [Nanoarchaeota archaeon]
MNKIYNKKGIAIPKLLSLLVAVFVFAVLIGFLVNSNLKEKFDNTLLDFEKEARTQEGSEYIAYSIDGGKVEYFDGGKWVEFTGVQKVGNKSINQFAMGKAFGDFWYGRNLPEDIDGGGEILMFQSQAKFANLEFKGFALAEYGSKSYILNYNNNLFVKSKDAKITDIGSIIPTLDVISQIKVESDSKTYKNNDAKTIRHLENLGKAIMPAYLKRDDKTDLVIQLRTYDQSIPLNSRFEVYPILEGYVLKRISTSSDGTYFYRLEYNGEDSSIVDILVEADVDVDTGKVIGGDVKISPLFANTYTGTINDAVSDAIVEWRDEKLKEKITLVYKDDQKGDVDGEYCVKKRGAKLIVDLSKPYPKGECKDE